MTRINTILPEDMIEKLDTIAHDEKKSRGKLIREAAERLIRERERLMEEKRRNDRMRRAVVTQDKLRRKSGSWDGVAELRKMRAAKG